MQRNNNDIIIQYYYYAIVKIITGAENLSDCCTMNAVQIFIKL